MKRTVCIILALLLTNASAVEMSLTEPEKATCEAEGGCMVITRAMLFAAMKLAHDSGAAKCETKL